MSTAPYCKEVVIVHFVSHKFCPVTRWGIVEKERKWEITEFLSPSVWLYSLFSKCKHFVLLSILLHDFKSQAFFLLCVWLTISLEVPQDKAKKGIGLEKANIVNGIQFSTTVWNKAAKNILTMFAKERIFSSSSDVDTEWKCCKCCL